MIDALLSDPAAILPPATVRKLPVLRIQADERAIELIPGPEFLTLRSVLGLDDQLGPMRGRRIRIQFGQVTSASSSIGREGPVLVAAVRFDAEAALALAAAAPRIRDLRLVPAN